MASGDQARRSWWRRLLGVAADDHLADPSDLMADPGELDVPCLGCHHNATMPMAALLPRYAAETPSPEAWGGFRCSACGSRRIDVRPHWAPRQAAGQITPP
jgi:hypothetical protein